MLGWILLGLAVTAMGVIVISGIVTKNKIREIMREKGLEDMLITKIDDCDNIVKLEQLAGDETMEIRGDDLDEDLSEYDLITV